MRGAKMAIKITIDEIDSYRSRKKTFKISYNLKEQLKEIWRLLATINRIITR
jgi:hypothetical protein